MTPEPARASAWAFFAAQCLGQSASKGGVIKAAHLADMMLDEYDKRWAP